MYKKKKKIKKKQINEMQKKIFKKFQTEMP